MTARDQLKREHTAVELRIGKKTHEVRPVARLDMIALQMQRNVAKRPRVAINVQRPNRRRYVDAIFLRRGNLTAKILRKV